MSNPFSAKPDPAGEVPTEMVMPDRELPSASKSAKHHDAPLPPSHHSDTNDGQDHTGITALTMEEKSCRSCRFLEFKGSNRKAISQGECRRMAPTPGNNAAASWPTVDWSSWCGEWASGIDHEDLLRMARLVAESLGEENDTGEEAAESKHPNQLGPPTRSFAS